MINYFVVDIETCPIDLPRYLAIENEEERRKLLNPIDSKIIAIGVRYSSENKIFLSENEKEILEKFWEEWKKIKSTNSSAQACGFDILRFDIPFIISRSLINNVIISPFFMQQIVDIKEKINAYRYGKTRGKLKEYASLLGLRTLGFDGSQIPSLCQEKNWNKLKEYLANDLEITDELYKRIKNLKILEIRKWNN